jgi:pyruvate carboxylase
VSNKLSEQDVWDKADVLSFPSSVLEYFQGYLGQPPYGFPEPLRTNILKARNLIPLNSRPGKSLPDLDLTILKLELERQWGQGNVSDYDVLSAALYPQVFEQFKTQLNLYGDLSSLPTQWFLTPMKIGQEFSFEIDRGKTVIIKLLSIGPLHEETFTRDVYFSLNGEARLLSIKDDTVNSGLSAKKLNSRKKADTKNKGDVGAPMSGVIVELRVKPDIAVKICDPLCVMSAMKMETIVTATTPGTVSQIHCEVGDSLSSGDLILTIS